MSWTAYWEGEIEQFHTLFLRWYDNLNKRPSTYTLPLKTAATEGGIQRSGRNVTFVWVRTNKEFERRGLAWARQAEIYAEMLAPPQPATARSTTTTTIQNTDNQHRLYTPGPTVTISRVHLEPGRRPGLRPMVDHPSHPHIRPGRNGRVRRIKAPSRQHRAGDERRDKDRPLRTDRWQKGHFPVYTVQPGDEAPVALKLPLNSLKLFSERGRQDGSIRNSEGTDAVLDHDWDPQHEAPGGRSCPGVLQRSSLHRTAPR